MESKYCSLCGCICVACAQFDQSCDDCDLLHPELVDPGSSDPDQEVLENV